MQSALKTHFSSWLGRRHKPEAGPVVLTQRRIYLLPTRSGVAFGFLLLLMLAGSINYSLSLGYVLTFLLGTMGLVSILHTFRNLAGLSIRPGQAAPVFAGQHARFGLCLESPGALARYSIALRPARHFRLPPVCCDIDLGETTLTEITLPASQRGLLAPGKITLSTTFPLGLFRAWACVEPDMHCLIYPRPDSAGVMPAALQRQNSGNDPAHGAGNGDFAGLRSYHAGDSSRHIAWKALAREQGLQVKQFSSHVQAELWLDWDDPAVEADALATEARLSRLTRWVLDADASGLSYGLRLPGKTIAPASGELHRRQCLEALALFE